MKTEIVVQYNTNEAKAIVTFLLNFVIIKNLQLLLLYNGKTLFIQLILNSFVNLYNRRFMNHFVTKIAPLFVQKSGAIKIRLLN